MTNPNGANGSPQASGAEKPEHPEIPDNPAELAAAAAAAGCPVDHSKPKASSAIPAATIGGPKTPALVQAMIFFSGSGKFMDKCRAEFGSRFRVNVVPGAKIYAISDPEDVKTMFLAPRDTLHTGTSSAIIEKFTGQTGLAWLDEAEHTARRKTLMPSFRGPALKRIEESIVEMAKRDVASWPRGEVVSLRPYVHQFTMNVIREVIFGSYTPRRWDELFEQLMRMMEINRRFASMIMLHKMSPAKLRVLKAIRPLGVHDFLKARARVDELISEAVKERMAQDDLSGDDMLSVMLGVRKEDGTQLTGTELRDEMMTMFLAGTETTAAAIVWALEFITRMPEKFDKLRAEIDAGESEEYLTALCHETLRLRPPTPQIIPREVVKPIEVGGIRYEPGMHLWASGYLLNRDPERYPEPDEFRPERFLGVKPGAHTWIPFGGGHTRCLGDRVALTEMKCVLREILTNSDLHRPDPTPERPRNRAVVIVPEHGMRLELRPRAHKPEHKPEREPEPANS